jgi:hypothetical protein
MTGWSPSEPRAVYGFHAGLLIILNIHVYLRSSLFMPLLVGLSSGYVGMYVVGITNHEIRNDRCPETDF